MQRLCYLSDSGAGPWQLQILAGNLRRRTRHSLTINNGRRQIGVRLNASQTKNRSEHILSMVAPPASRDGKRELEPVSSALIKDYN
jgi:hypothetical protein